MYNNHFYIHSCGNLAAASSTVIRRKRTCDAKNQYQCQWQHDHIHPPREFKRFVLVRQDFIQVFHNSHCFKLIPCLAVPRKDKTRQDRSHVRDFEFYRIVITLWHCAVAQPPVSPFVAVAGLEPATSPRMGRFANLASRHTLYIVIASPKPSELFCHSWHSFLSSFA